MPEAHHHALHLAFEVADARRDVAVFKGGRHLRFGRFVSARAAVH